MQQESRTENYFPAMVSIFHLTHMYPAQGDEIILVLYEEELLLIFGVAIIRPTALLRYDDVCHCKRISGLQQRQVISYFKF